MLLSLSAFRNTSGGSVLAPLPDNTTLAMPPVISVHRSSGTSKVHALACALVFAIFVVCKRYEIQMHVFHVKK